MEDDFEALMRAREKRVFWRDAAAYLTVATFCALLFSPTLGGWPVIVAAIVAAFALWRLTVWTAASRTALKSETPSDV